MIIQKLTGEFFKSQIGQDILLKLRVQKNNELYFHGLTDSAKGFFLASLVSSVNRPIVYLARDINFALNLYHEILNLTSAPIFYFPAQEVSPYDQISSDVEIVAQQAKTALHLLGVSHDRRKPCLIISTARCLLEKLWNKEELTNNTFTINHTTKVEPTELTRKLISIGYKKTPVVTNRGEFSLRGNIFDLCSVVGEPTRIEFFGEEIESIRTYSPTTQRSTEDVDKVLISPRYYMINPNMDELANKIMKLSKNDIDLKQLANQEIEQIKINTYFESLEYYTQLTNQKNSSLFDYLPPETLMLIDDWEANAISMESWYSRNMEIKNELELGKKIIPLPDSLLLHVEFVLSNLKKYSRSYIERFEVLDTRSTKIDTTASIDLLFKPAPYFQNQIERFAQQTREWLSLKNKIVIFSEQPQRIKGILKEWNIPSIYTELLKEEDYNNNHLFLSKEGTTNGFVMNFTNVVVLTDQEIFGTKRRPNLLKKISKPTKYEYYLNIEDLKPNDYVVHIRHGIGKYRGLVKMTIDDTEREYLMVEYASDGKLYLPVEQINLLYRYRGSAEVIPKLSRLGGADWELTKKKVKKAVKKIAEDLLNLYTARNKLAGFAFNADSHWQIEMEETFPYTETPDQWQAICDVKTDMESTKPTDRLICGDVGYGKTEVAIRAIFKAVLSGKQVAILVPTTILAQQHFNVMGERLAPYSVKIAQLSRFVSPREQKIIIGKLALGEIDIVIGTHRLLQKDVSFKDLGLVVIDEEQRFGVIHKEKLKQLRVMVDVITLSATPIPRTLHMALSGARDMSLINTPPANRLPIKTFIGEFKPTVIKTAILHELERGGQVYFVYNRVELINHIASYLKELVQEAKIAVAHGQMHEKELESVMVDFLTRRYNVLVCTTIIESGIDIPSVNTIIIDNSDSMGLAQLYQLRGRVGRAEIQAYAYCLYRADKVLSESAKNRLQAIKEFSTLGSGYQIALRDMEIRGVGNILGPEQHGHMISVGFDLYCQLLNEAVDKLRGLEVHDVELETVIDLNISAYIPSDYIQDEGQKVIEYKRLSNVRTHKELEYLASEWEDRFGTHKEEVKNLLKIVALRISASQVGIKYIKSESSSSIKLEVAFRLQKWLSIQKLLPKNLIDRTIFRSGAKGTSDVPSYILVKTSGLTAGEQLEILAQLLESLRLLDINEKIA